MARLRLKVVKKRKEGERFVRFRKKMSGGGEGGEDETTLEFTPTWVVAAVCTIIVAISLAAERLLHYGGKYLKRKDQKPLYEALQKIKEGNY